MRRAICAVLFCGVLAAIAAGAILAELVTAREVGKVLLIALLWHAISRFFEFLLGWNPHPPANQDTP